MNAGDEIGLVRKRLNFAHLVVERYRFLEELGFVESESMPTIVRYRKGDLDLSVYHGRRSFEVGLEIGHGDEQFSMSEMIRSSDPTAAEHYRNPVARTPADLASSVGRLANLLQRYGERGLRDDPQFFATLRQQRKSWSEEYALDVLAEQTRPKAAAAFQEGRYREAADLYEKIIRRLTPAEQKKLAVARRKAS